MTVWWIWYPVAIRPARPQADDTEAGVDLAKA